MFFVSPALLVEFNLELLLNLQLKLLNIETSVLFSAFSYFDQTVPDVLINAKVSGHVLGHKDSYVAFKDERLLTFSYFIFFQGY